MLVSDAKMAFYGLLHWNRAIEFITNNLEYCTGIELYLFTKIILIIIASDYVKCFKEKFYLIIIFKVT